MPPQALARKWRPKQFKSLIGQSHIVQALTHALTSQRLHHAYLFTGTRGTGKTTIARIIAKCLNCEHGISAEPCGQCTICRDIEAGRFVDLIEIDAASRTKVEDTREILENVMYAPTQGRYKIYLIDEVHMLSGHSFNALLKTLEEPPEHVIFLLATTDPQKLPITVLSRCLQFQLKALLPEQLAPHLAYILEQENITFEPKALELISHAAKGSVRDALSLLDQAIATGGGKVDLSITTNMLGLQGQQLIVPLAKTILAQNITEALNLAKQLAELAANFDQVLEQLMALFHNLSIKKLAPDFPVNSVIASDADLTELNQLCDAQDLQLCYQIALLAKRDLSLAPSLSLGFEMALLRMMAFKIGTETTVETKAPQHISKPLASAPVPPKASLTPDPAPAAVTTPGKPQAAPTAPLSSQHGSLDDNMPWHDLLPRLGLTALTKAFAEHLHFERVEASHFYFSLAETHAALLQDRHRQKLEAMLTQYFGQPISITIQIGKSQQAKASVVEHQQEQHQKKTDEALTHFKQDPQLQKVLTSFDGNLIPETLELNN